MYKSLSLLGLMFFALAGALVRPAAAATYYFNLRFSPTQTPFLYLQFKNNVLRMAATPEGLAKAKPIAAERDETFGNGQFRNHHFAELTLPTGAGAPEIRATLLLMENLPPRGNARINLNSQFKLLKTDAAGTKWTYLISPAETPAGTTPSLAPKIVLPHLNALTLRVESVLRGRETGIGLHAGADKIPLVNVLKNGRPAFCSIKIRNAGGKTISQENGDLVKFGFG